MKLIQDFNRKNKWNLEHNTKKTIFPHKLTKALKHSGMLCSKDAVVTDVSGQTTGPETSVN